MATYKRVWLLSGIVLGGFLLYLAFRTYLRKVLGLDYPFTSFLFLPGDRFMDFFNINEMVAHLDPYFRGSSYPPLALWIAVFFATLIPGTSSLTAETIRDTVPIGTFLVGGIYFCTIVGIVIFVGKYTAKSDQRGLEAKARKFSYLREALKSKIVLGLLLLGTIFFSAPVFYGFDRGNYLIICVLFLVLFAFSYYEEKFYLAACFLAIAASLKAFPVVLFLVFLLGRKWKPLFAGLLLGGGITAIGAQLFAGGLFLNMKRFIYAAFLYSGGFDSNHVYYYRHNISVRSFPGNLALVFSPNAMAFPQGQIIGIFLSVIVLIAVVLLCLWDKRIERQILYLCLLMILLPHPSFYYNLAYLWAPILLWLYKKTWNNKDTKIFILLAILMVPKTYVYLYGEFSNGMIHVPASGFLDPLIMLVILFVCLAEVAKERFGKSNNTPVPT